VNTTAFLHYFDGIEVAASSQNLKGRQLTDAESKQFDSSWKQVQRFYGDLGKTDLFGDDIKKAVATLLGVELNRRSDAESFDGLTPSGGVGLQPIDIRDVTGQFVTNVEWDYAWAQAAAGFQMWLGDNTGPVTAAITGAAGTTFEGASARSIIPRDPNDDEWATLIWGLLDAGPTPNAKAVRVEMTREVVGDHDVERQFRSNSIGDGAASYADLSRIYFHQPPFSFQWGLEFQDVPTGPEAVIPVGITIGSTTRLRQLQNNFRNRAVQG